MDAQLAELAYTGGAALVAVTGFVVMTRSVAKSAMHKARNLETALTAHRHESDRVFVRKETLEPQLKTITKALERIEGRQTTLFDRLMGPGS